jgi:PAS domain S-box-containing protein
MTNEAPVAYPGLSLYAADIISTLQEPLLIIGKEMKVLFANSAFYAKFLVSPEETVDREIYSLGDGQWNIPDLRKIFEEVIPRQAAVTNYEIRHNFPKIGERTMLVNARKLTGDGHAEAILVLTEDVTERREVEHKLLLSEVRYRKLFETAKDGILLIDPITEKIIDVNPFLLELMGDTFDEVIGKKLWEIKAIEDVEGAKKLFAELQAKGYVRFDDIPMKSKNGGHHEVEFVSNRYSIDETLQMIQCNIRDITDRKDAEKKSATYLEGLEKLNKMMTGRELKMVDLKKEIDELKEKLNLPK